MDNVTRAAPDGIVAGIVTETEAEAILGDGIVAPSDKLKHVAKINAQGATLSDVRALE